MKYSQGRTGRIFVIRLEDKDKLPQVLEEFAREKRIARAVCILLGGIGCGNVVVGPQDGKSLPPNPILSALKGVHEVAGVGTLFPDEEGVPRLHMHAALGRGETARTGCIRPGVEVWKLGELVLLEILDNSAGRRKDSATGFSILEP